MKRRAGKILGMAVGQKSILIAEVGGKAGAWSVHHLAEFTHPEGVSLEQPQELGQALKQFLREQKFSCREAVIGLPAKRLVTRRKEVPPAAPAIAANMLRLQAEGEFSSEPEGLVMDYAGETSPTATTSVLLMAVTRENVDQCTAIAKAAGLKLAGVTVTAAALGRATSRVSGGNEDEVVVSLAEGGAELVVQHGDASTQVRHLNVGDATVPESLGLLVGEIRRTVAALPRNGSPLPLALWNSSGNQGGPGSVLEQRLSMPVSTPELREIVSTGSTSANNVNRFAPAVAVALAELDGDRLPVDFLHSRLAPPPPASEKRKIFWAVAVAVLILFGIVYEVQTYANEKSDLAAKLKLLDSMKKPLAEAKTDKGRLELARKWAPGKPIEVSCLRDLTEIFPDDNSIWVTGLYIHPNLTGEILGKAANSRQVLNLLDRMNANAGFKGAKWTDAHDETNRGGNQIAFTISFTYHPTESARGTK